MSETAPDDFDGRLKEIERLFSNPPNLDFESAPANELEFAFPAILPAAERRIHTPPASELSKFFETATKKFYYQDFRSRDNAPELSWPNERLSKKNRLEIERDRLTEECVNASPEAASAWFRLDLVDGIRLARQPSCSFFVGLPGSGKSTLIKYLINKERAYSDASKVLFTRFESTKFFRYCGEKISSGTWDARKPWPTKELMSCFQSYYWAVVLRDLILQEAFEVKPDGSLERKKSNQNFKDTTSIGNFCARACAEARSDADQELQAFNALTAAIGHNAFRHKELFEIAPSIRKAMVKQLASDLKVCVIFDGLDALSPEDEILDYQKFVVLDFILVMYGWGSKGTQTAFVPGIDHHAMIMLRPNTLERFMDRVDPEIVTTEVKFYKIAELSPGVVLLRSIRRALQNAGMSGDDAEKAAKVLFRSLGTLFATIGTKFHLGPRAEALLSMFNGNLRDCFEYVTRVLVWIRDEGENKVFHHRPSIADLVTFINSAEARRLLKQKSYRLIELMLFYRTSSFQNAVIAENVGAKASKPIKETFAPPELHKNNSCKGLIDNVFNYHSFSDVGKNDDHNLLYKIRILQICIEKGKITAENLEPELVQLGYERQSSALERTIAILRFVGFLNRYDDGGNSYYSISTKGRVVVERLINQSSYLEHIFHKTLMPSALIARDRADTPRVDGLERWATESIRNYFTLLTYIRFVEENPARSKSVPDRFRIWPKMNESVVAAVRRILVQDHASKRSKSPSTWYATIVHHEMKELIDRWKANGVLVGEYCLR